jgi:hypothetical protein
VEFLDPRLALIGVGVAAVASERVRKVIGRGVGYVAAGTMKVGSPVVNAGRDIVEEARHTAGHNGKPTRAVPKAKTAATA